MLSEQQVQAVRKRLNALKDKFRAAFWTLVRQAVTAIDEQLVDDMKAKFKATPLADGDRVVLRQRVLWLIADHMKGPQSIPQTWTAEGVGRALCPRSKLHVELLDNLTRIYVEQAYSGGLKPNIEAWTEEATQDTMRELKLPATEFASVRGNIWGRFQIEAVGEITSRGALSVKPGGGT